MDRRRVAAAIGAGTTVALMSFVAVAESAEVAFSAIVALPSDSWPGPPPASPSDSDIGDWTGSGGRSSTERRASAGPPRRPWIRRSRRP